MLLKETRCPAKGHLMVFQTHRITLMYCRSKDKTGALARAPGKNEVPTKKKKKKAYQKFILVPVVAKDNTLVSSTQ